MSDTTKSVVRYLRKSLQQGLDPAKLVYATANYEKGREALADFEDSLRLFLDHEMRLGLVRWQTMMNFGRQVYGFIRRMYGQQLMDAVAQAGAARMRSGCTVEQLMQVVRRSFELMKVELPEGNAQELAESMQARASQQQAPPPIPQKEGENMAEDTKGQGSPATPPVETAEAEETLVLTKAELAERVQKYLKGRLEEGDAGSIAADLAEEVAKMPAKKRKAGARRAVPTSRLVSESATATEVDNFSQRRLVQALRGALAPFQPLVRRCVALRLWEHRSFDELAEDLGISRDDVADILTKLRPYVRRFTNYFDQDWYWVDGGKKYFIPQG